MQPKAIMQMKPKAIASIAGPIANAGDPGYTAAKAGLVGLTRALAAELGRHRITVNASLDRLRRNKSRATVPYPDLDDSPLADPVDFTANVDLSLSIGSALCELPPAQRDVIVAVDVEGLSYQEAARRLGISQGTVKSRTSRARAKLAVLLGHLHDDDP